MQRLAHDLLGSGVRLRVYEQNPEAPIPIVLLHGLFIDARTWDRTAESLALDHRIIYPDLPGFGESEKPPPSRFGYSIDAFVDVLIDLFGGLGLRRAVVIGQDVGGAIALSLAARHPELVRGLVLLCASCQPPAVSSPERALLLPVLGGVFTKQLLGRAVYRSLFRHWLLSSPKALDEARIDAFFEPLSSPSGRGSLLATLRHTSDTRLVRAQTARLSTPTLVVWGRQDRSFPVSEGQKLARSIRGAGFELLDAGHLPQEECPEALARSIRRFVAARLRGG